MKKIIQFVVLGALLCMTSGAKSFAGVSFSCCRENCVEENRDPHVEHAQVCKHGEASHIFDDRDSAENSRPWVMEEARKTAVANAISWCKNGADQIQIGGCDCELRSTNGSFEMHCKAVATVYCK